MKRKVAVGIGGIVILIGALLAWGSTIPEEEYLCMPPVALASSSDDEQERRRPRRRTRECSGRCQLGRAWGTVRDTIGRPTTDQEDERIRRAAGGIRGFADLPVCAD